MVESMSPGFSSNSGGNDDPGAGAVPGVPRATTAGVLVDESQRHLYDLNWEAILDDVTHYPSSQLRTDGH